MSVLENRYEDIIENAIKKINESVPEKWTEILREVCDMVQSRTIERLLVQNKILMNILES